MTTKPQETSERGFAHSRSWTLCAAAPLLLLVALAGCGGCSSSDGHPAALDPNKPWGGLGSKEAYMEWKAKEQERKAEDEKDAKPKPAATSPRPATAPRVAANSPAPAATPAPAARAVAATPAPEANKPPPLPAVPRDVTRWCERDFLVARLRQQLGLVYAIAHLGRQGSEDETSVHILAKLLEPGQFAELGESAVGTPIQKKPGFSEKVMKAAIDALGCNSTHAARRVLGQLIMGTLATENNAVAASQAVAVLAAHPSPAHEDMLLRVITDAEQLVASGSAGLSAEKLRQQALALVAQSTAPTLRTKVAQILIEKPISPAIRKTLENLLSTPVRENFDAHLALYLAPREVVSFRESMERQFAIYSGNALVSVLTPREGPADHAWNRRITETLWTEKFGLMVEARLNRLDVWSEEPELLSLACSLPIHSMRAAVARKLEKQWALGPDPFAAQQLSEKVVEPGALVLLRSIYEDRAKAEPARKTPLVSLRYGKRSDAEALRLREYQVVQESWAEAAGELAAAWCERCRCAALDRDARQRAKGLSIDWAALVGEFPIQPHSTEGLVAAYTVEWKGVPGSQGSDGQADVLRLHYIRIEERTRPKRVVAGYRRELPTLRPRETADGGCLEGVIEGSDPGFLRSVDIRITRAAYGARQSPDEEQELIVEILGVEVRNPGLDAP